MDVLTDHQCQDPDDLCNKVLPLGPVVLLISMAGVGISRVDQAQRREDQKNRVTANQIQHEAVNKAIIDDSLYKSGYAGFFIP